MRNKNLIGISGKIRSGKDTIGRIIQYLNWNQGGKETFENFCQIYKKIEEHTHQEIASKVLSGWEIKKYGGKLKDIVCILLSCTREDLESHEFKDKELGKAWWYYHGPSFSNKKLIPYEHTGPEIDDMFLVKLTPRKLLQLIGTECGREIVHPNIWVNALFADYRGVYEGLPSKYEPGKNLNYPKWIITDVRFPNELEAIENRDGITIRVNRTFPCGDVEFNGTQKEWEELVKRNKEQNAKFNHPSETALDNAEFDYVIDNNGNIESLIGKVQAILEIEKII